MPHVEKADYPADLPRGAFHHDADHVSSYRLAYEFDKDYTIYKVSTGTVTPGGTVAAPAGWVAIKAPGDIPQQVLGSMSEKAQAIMKDRRIAELEEKERVLQERLDARPVVSGPAQPTRTTARLGTPRIFTGVSNEKGEYDPAPREFTRSLTNYIVATEAQTGVQLDDAHKMLIAATFLDKQAGLWFDQQVAESDAAGAYYDGPMSNWDKFIEGLLTQFEDVDIQRTAIHKIGIIEQGTNTAEVHVRLFKDWAGHTGFNDVALIEAFKKSLKPALRDNINRQGRNRPTTLKNWYDDAVAFDRQWREDHPNRTTARTSTTTSSRPNPPPPPPAPQQQPRNANQWQPRTGQFRPWGSVAQPAQQQQHVDAMTRGPDPRCFKCGKTDGHFASNCPTPIAEIRRRWGRDSMFTPGGRAVQNRATDFADVGEFVGAMSQEQREELVRALQTGGAQGANQASQAPAPQGFASGSS